jgi:biotin operon repressor
MSDIIKEEIQTLSESGLEIKQVSGGISKKASSWFKNYLLTI